MDNLSKPKETEINDQLNQFKGWLDLLYVLMILGFISLSVNVIFGIFVFIRTVFFMANIPSGQNFKMIGLPLIITSYSITLFFIFKILRSIKTKESCIPDQIAKSLSLIITFQGIFIVLISLSKLLTILPTPYSIIGILIGALFSFLPISIFYGIWIAYFIKSKRVLAYYGQNAKNPFA